MAEKYLPIQYRLEIYVNSFANDPEVPFHSISPFLAINVGDEMEPSLWPSAQYGINKIAKVIAVRHIIWEIENDHIGHSLDICVKIQDKQSS